jgi:uncharacterized protein (TIGR03067 family)
MTSQALLLWAALLPAAGAAPTTDANASDLVKMQGDWMATSMTQSGIKLSEDDTQAHFRTVAGQKYSVFRYSKVIGHGTFLIDATKSPKTIDSMPVVSQGKPKPILGIYDFDGDRLRICNAPPGKPRPTDFEIKAGSNHTRIVWQPEKK